jgi:hypothetical protein
MCTYYMLYFAIHVKMHARLPPEHDPFIAKHSQRGDGHRQSESQASEGHKPIHRHTDTQTHKRVGDLLILWHMRACSVLK